MINKILFRVIFICIAPFLFFTCSNKVLKNITITADYPALSAQFVQALADQKDPSPFLKTLSEIPPKELRAALNNDNKRKAFWINIYNGHVQYLLSKDISLFDDRRAFFANKRVHIAGYELSLEDIEHGIIRGNKAKLALGFLPKLFPKKVIKLFKVKELDYRIHFALNCGAKSCPKVAIYNENILNEQLNASSKIFLNNTTTYDPATNSAKITTLFSWFRGDFGNKLEVLKKHGAIPIDAKPDLSYDKYDWTPDIGNYIDLGI